jgi:hypothetical protein
MWDAGTSRLYLSDREDTRLSTPRHLSPFNREDTILSTPRHLSPMRCPPGRTRDTKPHVRMSAVACPQSHIRVSARPQSHVRSRGPTSCPPGRTAREMLYIQMAQLRATMASSSSNLTALTITTPPPITRSRRSACVHVGDVRVRLATRGDLRCITVEGFAQIDDDPAALAPLLRAVSLPDTDDTRFWIARQLIQLLPPGGEVRIDGSS